MITNDVEKLPTLFREITSNNYEDFYCLNCLHSYRRKEKLKKHEKVFNNHNYYYVKKPNKI